jgi:hypothetical protein
MSIGMLGAAFVLPLITMLCPSRLDIAGKTIVFYEKGFLNWLKPEWGEYGRLSQGMYGFLGRSKEMPDAGTSRFLELYGAKSIVSPDLSAADLSKADALVMMYPDKPWEAGQVDRVRNYVKNGGTLLLFGEHTIHQDLTDDPVGKRPRWRDESEARFNDLLADTNMRVKFDSAEFAIGGWLQSYQALAHPITEGVRDEQNVFGVVIGASVMTHWPANPILVGRYGFSDTGDEGNGLAMLGNQKYDPGEKLGDVVLCAEQRVGSGRVVLFGDTSMMSNGLLHGCYPFVSRLLAYISNPGANPQAMWRQLFGLFIGLAMVACIGFRPHPLIVTIAAILMATSISLYTTIGSRNAKLIPNAHIDSLAKSNLVYIGTSKHEVPSLESWRDQGTMGLALCWERSGHIVLGLPELSEERLKHAAVYISLAPAQAFTDDERRIIHDWVNDGGILICAAGWDRRQGLEQLLADFGLYIGAKPGQRAPEPLGWFKSPYVENGDYKGHVRFWAAWPVLSADPGAQPIAYGGGDKPVILVQSIGNKGGKVALIGDTDFALNKNLEREGGQPFEDMRENADFWRWFIDELRTGKHEWMPTAPATQPSQGGTEVSQ